MERAIIIFDTHCILCSGFVQFILRHERDDLLTFVNAWSDTGTAKAAQHDFCPEDLQKTFLVITDGRALTRSDAMFEILRHLNLPWRAGRVFRFVPRPLRDAVYSLVARNRYRWFGYQENCLLVPPKTRHRFVDMAEPTMTPEGTVEAIL